MKTFQVSFLPILLTLLQGLFNIGICQNAEERGSYFEGDMLGTIPTAKARSGLVSTNRRWPNATVVYEFEPSYPLSLRRLFSRATEHISARTCVKFKERTGNERDYISVMSGTGCYSYVGRIGGKQNLSLPYGCRIIGTFVHEIIHALGFTHEQSRTDRDNFVKINYENIREASTNNFRKYPAATVSAFGVNYDYDSVMHYSSKAFSKNGGTTIDVLNKNVKIGQRTGMSKGDIEKVNNMYCKDKIAYAL